jgi:hypothetical protein
MQKVTRHLLTFTLLLATQRYYSLGSMILLPVLPQFEKVYYKLTLPTRAYTIINENNDIPTL